MSEDFSTQGVDYTDPVEDSFLLEDLEETPTAEESESADDFPTFSESSYTETETAAPLEDDSALDEADALVQDESFLDSLSDDEGDPSLNPSGVYDGEFLNAETDTEHFVSGNGNGKNTSYTIESGKNLYLFAVPVYAFVRAVKDNGNAIVLEIVDPRNGEEKILERVTVNWQGEKPGNIFVMEGSHLDTSGLNGTGLEKNLHYKKYSADLRKDYTDRIANNTLYQLRDFRITGDTYDLTLEGEKGEIDLIGNGRDEYSVTATPVSGKPGYYDLTITIDRGGGEKPDVISLKGVSKTHKINLFGGGLMNPQGVPEELQGVFSQNFDAPDEDSSRMAQVREKMDGTEAKLSSLPLLGSLSRAESQALYGEAWQIFEKAVGLLNGNSNAGDVVADMEALCKRAGRDDPAAAQDLATHLAKLLSTEFPELFFEAGRLGLLHPLAAVVSHEGMTVKQVEAYGLLSYAGGKTEKEIQADMKKRGEFVTVTTAVWDQISNQGLSLFRGYLRSGVYTRYEQEKEAGSLILNPKMDDFETDESGEDEAADPETEAAEA